MSGADADSGGSRRDIGMFKYVDHFFPDEEYNKLVVHFTINDIAFAEVSLTDFQRENTSLPSDATCNRSV
eukprot:1195573-Rhodomonas_salina.2